MEPPEILEQRPQALITNRVVEWNGLDRFAHGLAKGRGPCAADRALIFGDVVVVHGDAPKEWRDSTAALSLLAAAKRISSGGTVVSPGSRRGGEEPS